MSLALFASRQPGAAALAIAALVAASCTTPPGVPTATVVRRDFVHRVRAEGTLVAERATPIVVPAEIQPPARIVWLAEDGIEVAEGDVVVRFDAFEMQRRLDQGSADVATSVHQIDKAHAEGESQLVAIEGDRKVAELELDVADRYQKTDEEVFSRFEILSSAIDGELAEERRARAQELAGIRRSLAETERALLEIEKGRAARRVDEARAGLSALEVRAPHTGVLTWIRDRGEPIQVGQQVWRGQTLGEIPQLGYMKAEVFVLEADAGGLAIGKRAAVRVEAYPDEVYAATVRRVDTLARPRQRRSPIQYFGVELALEETDAARMRPGQRVVATLVLEEREDVLVMPRQALVEQREHDAAPPSGGGEGPPQDDAVEPSRGRVFVRSGERFVEREVVLGPRSASLVVIESGLVEGDVVALEPPAQASTPGEETEPPHEPAPDSAPSAP